MKTRILSLLLLGCLVLGLCACQGGGTSLTEVDMGALQTAMVDAAPNLTGVQSITSDVEDAKTLFSKFCDLDYGKVSSYLLTYSITSKADEIVVVAVKDPDDVSEAKEALQTHLDSRLNLFRQYSPSEVGLVEKAEFFTQDQYVVLIICEDAKEVRDAFTDFLKNWVEG